MSEKKTLKQIIEIVLVVIIFGCMDFLAILLFQDTLDLPLFFDTIFMTATLFLFGPVAAFFEYLVYMGISCIRMKVTYGSVHMIYLYSVSALTIIVITWLFIRRKGSLKKNVNRTFIILLSAAIFSGLACSVVSGFINFFIYFKNENDLAYDRVIFAFNGEQFGFLASAILGRIPVTILDRIITTFAAFGIFNLYSKIKTSIQKIGGGGYSFLWKLRINYEKTSLHLFDFDGPLLMQSGEKNFF